MYATLDVGRTNTLEPSKTKALGLVNEETVDHCKKLIFIPSSNQLFLAAWCK